MWLPMEPFVIVAINDKYVVALPSQKNACMTNALTAFILLHNVQAGHNVCHRRSPCPWLTNFIGTTRGAGRRPQPTRVHHLSALTRHAQHTNLGPIAMFEPDVKTTRRRIEEMPISYAPLFRLNCGIITQIARCTAHHMARRKHHRHRKISFPELMHSVDIASHYNLLICDAVWSVISVAMLSLMHKGVWSTATILQLYTITIHVCKLTLSNIPSKSLRSPSVTKSQAMAALACKLAKITVAMVCSEKATRLLRSLLRYH